MYTLYIIYIMYTLLYNMLSVKMYKPSIKKNIKK